MFSSRIHHCYSGTALFCCRFYDPKLVGYNKGIYVCELNYYLRFKHVVAGAVVISLTRALAASLQFFIIDINYEPTCLKLIKRLTLSNV